jgi:sec-independent protein translocase protein TatB
MFDIGWSELMIIGVVALIVVGPKDLPMMFRKLGNFVGKARGMARDFQSAMNQAADESGVKDLADSVKKAADIKSDLTGNAIGENMKNYAKSFTDADGGDDSEKIAADLKPAADVPSVKPPKQAAKKAPAKKPAAKKATTKKPVAKKTAAKKPATKKTTATKAKS